MAKITMHVDLTVTFDNFYQCYNIHEIRRVGPDAKP